MRKKKIADSQLLIPKSYKEKQAKAARRRYRKTVIRIQFPDGVVLQAVFNPWEPTSSLYEVSPLSYFLFNVLIFFFSIFLLFCNCNLDYFLVPNN